MSAYDLLTEEVREALRWVRKHGGVENLSKRLMPEGMEWPRYESGEPVLISDYVVGPSYGERLTVDAIKFCKDGFVVCDSCGVSMWYESDDRFKRHAVIAADGEPLDSWERIELDLSKSYIEYWGCGGIMCNHCPAEIDGKKPHERFGVCSRSCVVAMRRDLVRRAQALAERGEQE